jgi:uncharacterized membrane protein
MDLLDTTNLGIFMMEEKKMIKFCIIIFIIGIIGVSLINFKDELYIALSKNLSNLSENLSINYEMLVILLPLSLFLIGFGSIVIAILLALFNLKNLAKFLFIFGLLMCFGLFLMPVLDSIDGVIVKSYEADLLITDVITLNEKYTYEIFEDGRYRMLYRNWKAPLLYKGELNSPYIKVINFYDSADMIPYIVDYYGNIYIFSNNKLIRERLMDLIYRYYVMNEVGFYNPCKYSAGTYITGYEFEIYPPIETDNKVYHINLKLADEHLYYKNVKINVVADNKILQNLFVYPSTFKVRKTFFGYVIEGSSPKNTPIRIEMLLKPYSVAGFVKYADNVEEKTISTYNSYMMIENIIKGAKYLLTAIILLLPLIAYLIYLRFGKEKSYTVPEYLSYVPNKGRKPWIVNLIFNNDVGLFDENGFYATLLDLHNRGYIKIMDYGRIKILKKNLDDLDSYESDVMKFLIKYSKDDIFDPKYIETLAHKLSDEYRNNCSFSAKDKLHELNNEIWKIMEFPRDSLKLEKTFLETKGRKVLLIFLVVSIVLAIILAITLYLILENPGYHPALKDVFYLSIILVVQNIVLISTPRYLFGRWKDDYYKEKLEWEAFKNFLSDFAKIEKYSPKDLSIWKEWLIYGTALGVGDKVVEAMKSLNIDIPEVDITPTIFTTYSSMSASVSSAYSSATRSSGGGVGGGSVGGGFGGGGAGAR